MTVSDFAEIDKNTNHLRTYVYKYLKILCFYALSNVMALMLRYNRTCSLYMIFFSVADTSNARNIPQSPEIYQVLSVILKCPFCYFFLIKYKLFETFNGVHHAIRILDKGTSKLELSIVYNLF